MTMVQKKVLSIKKKITRYFRAIIMVENIFLETEEELKEKLVRKENLFLIKIQMIQMNLILIMLMMNVQQKPKEESSRRNLIKKK